jgi:hypothetical protein
MRPTKSRGGNVTPARNEFDSFFPLTGRIAEHRDVIESAVRRFCWSRRRSPREVINDAIILADRADRTYDPALGEFKTHLLNHLKGLGRATDWLRIEGDRVNSRDLSSDRVNTAQKERAPDHGEWTVPQAQESDARAFRAPHNAVKGWWEDDEPIKSEFSYNGSRLRIEAKPFDRGETWKDFSRRKRRSYSRQLLQKAAPEIKAELDKGNDNPETLKAIIARAHGNDNFDLSFHYRERDKAGRRINRELEQKLAAVVKTIKPLLTVIELGVLNWRLGTWTGTDKRTLSQLADDLGLSGKGQASKICKRVLKILSEYGKNIS